MQKTKLSVAQCKEIVQKYRNGASMSNLAREYLTSIPRLKGVLEKYKVKIRPHKARADIDELLKLRDEGWSLSDLAKKYGYKHKSAIQQFLTRYGKTDGESKTVNQSRPCKRSTSVDELIRLRNEGWSLSDLAKKYGYKSVSTVQYLLKRYSKNDESKTVEQTEVGKKQDAPFGSSKEEWQEIIAQYDVNREKGMYDLRETASTEKPIWKKAKMCAACEYYMSFSRKSDFKPMTICTYYGANVWSEDEDLSDDSNYYCQNWSAIKQQKSNV